MLTFAPQQDHSQHKSATSHAKPKAESPVSSRPELAISSPGNVFEKEADDISDRVMRMPAPQLQRACPCGGGCPNCQAGTPVRENLHLQTKRVQPSNPDQTTAPPSVHEVLRSHAQPLDPVTRAFMEPRFGHDFSSVRIHSGAAAEQSARDVSASAYTVGNDIVFGAGRYAPETNEGRKLLAHELTHVVQNAPGLHRNPDPPAPATPAPSTPTPATPETPPLRPSAPYRLDLANPRSDAEAHASLYELLPALAGRLSQEYNIDNSLAWRLLEWTAMGIGFMTEMTYSHEDGGHGRSARSAGLDPTITLNAPWSGVTSPGGPLNPQQELEFTVAGVNQQHINATRMASRWTLRRDISYQEAMAYLYAQTNLAAYAVRTFALSITDPKDDVYSYVLAQGSLSVGELMALAAVADLLSGPAWAALLGQWNYLRHGERRVTIPTFSVGGGMRATIPNWQLLLSSRGPLLGGRSTINVNGRFPVEVSIDMGLDEPGIAVGAQLHAPINPQLTLRPFGRFSYSQAEGAGGLVGLEADYKLTRHVGINARLSYRHDDLLSEPEGAAEGFGGRAALTLSF